LEDGIQTNYPDTNSQLQYSRTGVLNDEMTLGVQSHLFAEVPSGTDPFSHKLLRQPTVNLAVRTQVFRVLGSLEKMNAISAAFFVGTHQRFPTLSRYRFYTSLQSSETGLRSDFLVLCLCIHLVQHLPSPEVHSMQSSLYLTVKNLISLLEATADISLDIVHCRILVTFYEMGHGLDTAAYISVAACARAARVIGLHRKPWRQTWRQQDTEAQKRLMEEQKRMWWAIVNMDRFINLHAREASFVADDPEQSDPLPIQDLIWSEDVNLFLEGPAPVLGTAANVTVGQMARESQVSHLAGRVARHVFDPTPDPVFNAEEAVLLERTLESFLPLLRGEELRIGKYCGSLGICHRYVNCLVR
jgi:Fungal specific transcription factor domain